MTMMWMDAEIPYGGRESSVMNGVGMSTNTILVREIEIESPRAAPGLSCPWPCPRGEKKTTENRVCRLMGNDTSN